MKNGFRVLYFIRPEITLNSNRSRKFCVPFVWSMVISKMKEKDTIYMANTLILLPFRVLQHIKWGSVFTYYSITASPHTMRKMDSLDKANTTFYYPRFTLISSVLGMNFSGNSIWAHALDWLMLPFICFVSSRGLSTFRSIRTHIYMYTSASEITNRKWISIYLHALWYFVRLYLSTLSLQWTECYCIMQSKWSTVDGEFGLIHWPLSIQRWVNRDLSAVFIKNHSTPYSIEWERIRVLKYREFSFYSSLQ